MFAGITQHVSEVMSAKERGLCRAVSVRTPRGWKLAKGQSVLVDGICSTVVKLGRGAFEVEYMPQTLSKTTARSFEKGTLVNLERSLRLRDFVDGHMVSGHVDALARVVDVKKRGASMLISLEVPKELKPYIALRGSIAVNGVSLTIAHKSGRHIVLALIPHTIAHTNLGNLEKGMRVNVEADMLARALVARTEK